MEWSSRKQSCYKLSLLTIALACLPSAFAAQPVALSKHDMSIIKSTEIKETIRHASKNGTLHVRVQQTYAGYPVLGADAIIHIPNAGKSTKSISNFLTDNHATTTGTIYHGLDKDLSGTNVTKLFNDAQNQKAIKHALVSYQEKMGGKPATSNVTNEKIVYIDQNNKPHYAFKVSFNAEPMVDDAMPEMPTYIIDATSLKTLAHWDNARAALADTVAGGGFGGNAKTGKFTYDGSAGNQPSFLVTRDANTCFMQNAEARVKRIRSPDIVSYTCASPDSNHNNVFWSGELDRVANGYSTANDALFNSQIVHNMFNTWYHVPVVGENGQPKQVSLILHSKMSGAIYAGGVISLGDSTLWLFHPFTTLDIMSHEFSHGFTEQYSNLGKIGQPGAVAEAFGDATAKAVELFHKGTQSYTFASDVMTQKNESLRYFEQPSKDCGNKQPGDFCSIDHVSQYKSNMSAQYAAGVFNRAFYNLVTTAGWDIKKGYDVLVDANMHYWTSTSDFNQAACGIVSSARDLSYDANAVVKAFSVVGIDASAC